MSVSYEDTKFHEAARFNDVDLLNQAIRERVDPNAIGLYEWTALHEAVLGGDVIITSKLLQNGADPSVRDLVNGSTPMHLAAGEGNLAILRLLVENGGNIDVRDDGGKTVYDVTEDVLCKKFLKEIREKRTLNAKESKETKLYLAKKVLERGMSQLDVEHVVKFEENVDVPEVLLSVEYNLKSGSLKIRVRKVKRMRRPDGDMAAATSLYVKSYLASSSGKQESKQKTEEISLTPLPDTPQSETIDSLLPDMEFFTPLEYTHISKDKIQHYFVVISICCYFGWPITSSSNLASMSLPLTTAVKVIMPTWFGLQPCVHTQQPKARKQSNKAQQPSELRPGKPINAWVGGNNSTRNERDEISHRKESKSSTVSWKGVKNVWQSVSGRTSQVKVFAVEREPFETKNKSVDDKFEIEETIDVTQKSARPIESFNINRSIPDPFAIESPEKSNEPSTAIVEKPPMVKTRESAQLIDIIDDDELATVSLVDVMQGERKQSKVRRQKPSDENRPSIVNVTTLPVVLPAISNLKRSALLHSSVNSSDGKSGQKPDQCVPRPPQVKTRQSATLIDMDILDDQVDAELQSLDTVKKPQRQATSRYHMKQMNVRQGWT